MTIYNDDQWHPMPYTDSWMTGRDYPDAQARVTPTNSYGQVVLHIKNTAARDGYFRDVYWQMYDANMVPVGQTGTYPYGPSGGGVDGTGEAHSGPVDIDSDDSLAVEGAEYWRNGARYVTFFQEGKDPAVKLITFLLLAQGEEPPGAPKPRTRVLFMRGR